MKLPAKYLLFSSVIFLTPLWILISASIPQKDVLYTSQDTNKSYYERGLEETNLGNIEEGLTIWEEAADNLEEPDFRIARSYINVAVANRLKDRYLKASEIYYWGLEGEIDENEQAPLLQELEYLKPMLGRREHLRLVERVEQQDPSVLNEISDFWESIDVTPLTDYNERLIEHYERINYSLENFSKSDSGELDDRGNTYIKYGDPYYTKRGNLTYNSSIVIRLLNEGIPSYRRH